MKGRHHDEAMAEVYRNAPELGCFMTSENHWLKTEYRTLFRLCPDGRIERENDPDCSPGPRFWLAGCSEGNVFGVRADVPDDLAARLERLATIEPPFTHPAMPKHLERYLSLLGGDGPLPTILA